MTHNDFCKWNAALKAINFQNHTEPMRLFNISNFSSIVETELGCCNNEKQLDYPLKPALHLYYVGISIGILNCYYLKYNILNFFLS